MPNNFTKGVLESKPFFSPALSTCYTKKKFNPDGTADY